MVPHEAELSRNVYDDSDCDIEPELRQVLDRSVMDERAQRLFAKTTDPGRLPFLDGSTCKGLPQCKNGGPHYCPGGLECRSPSSMSARLRKGGRPRAPSPLGKGRARCGAEPQAGCLNGPFCEGGRGCRKGKSSRVGDLASGKGAVNNVMKERHQSFSSDHLPEPSKKPASGKEWPALPEAKGKPSANEGIPTIVEGSQKASLKMPLSTTGNTPLTVRNKAPPEVFDQLGKGLAASGNCVPLAPSVGSPSLPPPLAKATSAPTNGTHAEHLSIPSAEKYMSVECLPANANPAFGKEGPAPLRVNGKPSVGKKTPAVLESLQAPPLGKGLPPTMHDALSCPPHVAQASPRRAPTTTPCSPVQTGVPKRSASSPTADPQGQRKAKPPPPATQGPPPLGKSLPPTIHSVASCAPSVAQPLLLGAPATTHCPPVPTSVPMRGAASSATDPQAQRKAKPPPPPPRGSPSLGNRLPSTINYPPPATQNPSSLSKSPPLTTNYPPPATQGPASLGKSLLSTITKPPPAGQSPPPLGKSLPPTIKPPPPAQSLPLSGKSLPQTIKPPPAAQSPPSLGRSLPPTIKPPSRAQSVPLSGKSLPPTIKPPPAAQSPLPLSKNIPPTIKYALSSIPSPAQFSPSRTHVTTPCSPVQAAAPATNTSPSVVNKMHVPRANPLAIKSEMPLSAEDPPPFDKGRSQTISDASSRALSGAPSSQSKTPTTRHSKHVYAVVPGRSASPAIVRQAPSSPSTDLSIENEMQLPQAQGAPQTRNPLHDTFAPSVTRANAPPAVLPVASHTCPSTAPSVDRETSPLQPALHISPADLHLPLHTGCAPAVSQTCPLSTSSDDRKTSSSQTALRIPPAPFRPTRPDEQTVRKEERSKSVECGERSSIKEVSSFLPAQIQLVRCVQSFDPVLTCQSSRAPYFRMLGCRRMMTSSHKD